MARTDPKGASARELEAWQQQLISCPGEREIVRMVVLEPAESEAHEKPAGEPLGWLAALKRHPWPPILLGLFAAGCGYLTILKTPVYRARTALEFQSVSEGMLSVKIGDFNPATDSGGSGAEGYLQTQVGILQSQTLRRTVLARFVPYQRTLPETPILGMLTHIGIGSRARKSAGAPPLRLLQVRNVAGTRLVEIACDSEDPAFASAFVNALAREYIDHTLDARWNATQRTVEWLEKQLEEQRTRLRKTEDELQRYSRSAGIVFSGERQSVDQEKLKELQGALAQAIVDRTSKQSTSETAGETAAGPRTYGSADGRLSEVQSKLIDLRRELAELTTTFSSSHYRVKRVQAQIAELESELEAQHQGALQQVVSDYTTAQRREKLLAEEIQNQIRVVSNQAQKEIYYNLLKHEADVNRQIYDTLLQKLGEAGVASAARASTVRVVDPAEPPRVPDSPTPLENAAIGLAAGSLLGVALVLMKDHSDTSFKSPGDTTQHLSLPELGVIPSAEVRVPRREHLFLSAKGDSEPMQLGAPAAASLALTTLTDRNSAIAESFRSTLTSVLFRQQGATNGGVLTLTSAAPGEGKTTVVSNLAIALAEANKRVLVIDADLRNPRLHQVFDIANSWGLSDLLKEDGALEELPIDSLVRTTRITRVQLLPSGPATVNVWQLLHSVRLTALLARLRREFDMVLIDTPPMMHCPDARVIARLTDAVILIVRARATSREVVRSCCQRFAEDGTSVLGAVLNDWTPADKHGRYYESYYSSYHKATGS